MGDDLHRLEIFDSDGWAEAAAELLGTQIEAVLDVRGQCTLALSGGSTPMPVFQALACRELDWDRVVLLQVDERLVPRSSPDRNLTDQLGAFEHLPITGLPLPVDELLAEGLPPAGRPGTPALAPLTETSPAVLPFLAELQRLAGTPPVLDIVHLGLGDDGHTASLFPDDLAVDELRHPLALTDERAGHRRLTMTRPVLDRARSVFWLVRGSSKARPLGRLLAGDLSIPAGLIRPAHSVVIADSAAARQF